MCFLACIIPSLIKQMTLKLKKKLCCFSKDDKNDEIKNKLKELNDMEENIDSELIKLINDVHKFKSELYNYKKHKRVYWSNYDN